ncbi:hypothetical protein [Bacillus sp. 'calajunan']|uniref:hypothetical protein n=1 Tax=Bacillus sp. 'calajunan' TaxID=3447457 RepID=UPI003EE34DA8
MNYQTYQHRQCEYWGAPPAPTNTPPAPTWPQIPTIPDMCKCIRKWTYFWTINGNKWIYVLMTGVGTDTQTNTPIDAVWGCNSTGNFEGIALKNITNWV